MSNWAWGIITLTVFFVGIWGTVLLWAMTRPSRQRPASPQSAPVAAEDLPEVPQQPLVFDPDNPPRFRNYRRDGYDPERAPSCTCHGIKIQPGERVLLWPIPNHPDDAMEVFCYETYSVMEGQS